MQIHYRVCIDDHMQAHAAADAFDGLGCVLVVSVQILKEVKLDAMSPNLLVGASTCDDAAV